MTNNKIYEELIQEYKNAAKMFDKETPVQEKLEKLIALDITLMDNIENLSSKELTKIRLYSELTERLYRKNLEFTWRGRF